MIYAVVCLVYVGIHGDTATMLGESLLWNL